MSRVVVLVEIDDFGDPRLGEDAMPSAEAGQAARQAMVEAASRQVKRVHGIVSVSAASRMMVIEHARHRALAAAAEAASDDAATGAAR